MFSVFDEIGFNEEHHKYTFESAPHITPLSVSGIIGQYKKPFDSDFHAGRKAESLGIDKQVILDQWAESARIGCDKGTISHQYLETLLESEQYIKPWGTLTPSPILPGSSLQLLIDGSILKKFGYS